METGYISCCCLTKEADRYRETLTEESEEQRMTVDLEPAIARKMRKGDYLDSMSASGYCL